MNKSVSVNGVKVKIVYLIASVVLAVAAIITITIAVVGGRDESLSEPVGSVNSIKPVTAEDLIASPYDYKGASITFTGRVFVAEGGTGEQALQVYSDIDNSDGNIAVYNFSSTSYAEGDYVTVTGKVDEASDGENAFGAKLTVPVVVADSIEEVSADDAVAPAIHTVKPNKTKTFGGVSVTLKKVEYAESETRLHLVFDNKSSNDYSFYRFNSTLIQNRKSFKEKSVYDRDNDYDSDGTITAGTVENVTIYYNPIRQGVNAVFTAQVTDNSSYNDSKLQFTFK